MRYSKKVIVGFIVLLTALMSPRLVFGDDDLVRVTPQIAVEQAQTFFDDVSDEPVTACDPSKNGKFRWRFNRVYRSREAG